VPSKITAFRSSSSKGDGMALCFAVVRLSV